MTFAMIFSSLDITAFAAGPNVDPGVSYMSGNQGWMSSDESVSKTTHLVAYAISKNNVSAYKGDSAELKVYAYTRDDQGKSLGSKGISYQWYKKLVDRDNMTPDQMTSDQINEENPDHINVTGDEVLWGETSDTLKFENVTEQVTGEYYVVVTNDATGEQVKVSYSLSLNSMEINIKFKESTYEKQLGDSITMELQSSTNKLKDLTYKWYFRAKTNQEWTEIPGWTKSYYQIDSLKKAEVGYYLVEATNANGDTNEAQARVKIYSNSQESYFNLYGTCSEEKVDYVDGWGQSYGSMTEYRYLGDSITMEGIIDQYGSNPEVMRDYSFAWAKYDSDNDSYVSITGAKEISYYIASLKEEDFGEYRLTATCGKHSENFYFYLNQREWEDYEGEVKVYVKGQKYANGATVEKKIGDSTKLEVATVLRNGIKESDLTYQWYKGDKDGVSIPEADVISGATKSYLDLSKLSEEDFRWYACEVTYKNTAGETISSDAQFNLTEKNPIQIYWWAYNQYAYEGGNATFSIAADITEGEEIQGENLTYQWYKQNSNGEWEEVNQEGAQTNTLKLSNVSFGEDNTSNYYKVKISYGKFSKEDTGYLYRLNTPFAFEGDAYDGGTEISGRKVFYATLGKSLDLIVPLAINGEFTSVEGNQITCQWYDSNDEGDYVAMEGQTDTTLHLDSVNADDYHTFLCEVTATDATGETKMTGRYYCDIMRSQFYASSGEYVDDYVVGDTLTFLVQIEERHAGGEDKRSYTYQWYRYVEDDESTNDVPWGYYELLGYAEDTYTYQTSINDEEYLQFMCLVSDGETTQSVHYCVGRKNTLTANVEGTEYYYDVVADIGDAVDLTVYAESEFGQDKISYQWYQNDEKITGATGANLHINALTEEGYGEYKCKVSDGNNTRCPVAHVNHEAGKEEEEYLYAYAAGTEKENDVDIDAYPGDTLDFEVVTKASKNSKLTYQWYKNGNAITGATGKNYRAEIEYREKESWINDYYECVISDGNDTASVSYDVDIQNDGNLNAELPSALINPGKTYNWKCEASTKNPNGKLSYQWYRMYGDDEVLLDCTSDTITVTPTKNEDYGPYWCRVTDGYETVFDGSYIEPFEVTASITVDNQEPTTNSSVFVKKGQKVTLEGIVSGMDDTDTSAYTYLWQKWDAEKEEYVTVGTDKTYVISSADEKTVGEYFVAIIDGEINNATWISVGLEQDQPIPVSITSDAWEMDEDDEDSYERMQFSIGEQVTYTAKADVDFDVTYQWYHNGHAIKGATKSTYTVDVEDQAQAGYYYVAVAGKERTGISDSMKLNVWSHIRILSDYYNYLDLYDNSTVNLKVDAVGDTELNYQWYKYSNGNGYIPLDGETSNILTTTFKTEELQGQSYIGYLCKVYSEENSEGAYTCYYLSDANSSDNDDDDDDDDDDDGYTQNTVVVNPSYTMDYYVTKGESKTLRVEASSKTGAPLSYQWYRRENVDTINGGYGYEYAGQETVYKAIQGATAASYTVSSVESDGDYFCIVSDGTCSRSANFKVNLIDEYNSITQFPYSVSANARYDGEDYYSNTSYYCYQYNGEDKNKVEGLKVRLSDMTSNCDMNSIYICDENGDGRHFDMDSIGDYEDDYGTGTSEYFDYTVEGTTVIIKVYADDCYHDSISAVIESITPVYDLDDDDDDNNEDGTRYTVTYMDGSEVIPMDDAVSKYETGKGLVLPAATKSGKVFGGWYKNPELTGSRVSRISTTATGDKTLYAKWLDNPKTVKSVDITTSAPVAGRTLPAISAESGDYEVASAGWYETEYKFEGSYAQGGTVYYAKVILEAAENTVFSADATAKIAGNNATVKISADRRQLVATYTFPKTGEIIYNIGYNYDKTMCSVTGPTTVKQNERLAFDIQLKSGYEKYRVKVNGSTVQADENGKIHYETNNIYSDTSFTISVTKQQVSKVAITMDEVVANQILPTTVNVPKNANYKVSSIQWKDAAGNSAVIAELGAKYSYRMTVQADDWAEFAQYVKSTVNEEDVTCELQEDGSLVVSGTISTGYQVAFTQGDNYKVTDVKGATITKLGVAEGGKAYFKVVPDEGIAKENVVVKAGDTILTPNEQGVYTLENVTGNISVTVKINVTAISEVTLMLAEPKAGTEVSKTEIADGDKYTAKVDWGTDATKFEYGTVYTPSITLKPAAGYSFTKDTVVELNGKKVIARNKKLNLNGSYVITGKEMHTENLITFYMPDGYGVTTVDDTAIADNKTEVAYGDSYQFKITGLQEGKKLIVKANGEYLTPLNAIYTIENTGADVQVVIKEEETKDSSTSSVFARFFDLYSLENPTGAKDEGLVDTIEVKNNSWVARNDVDNTLPILASNATKTFVGWYQDKDTDRNGVGSWFTRYTTMDKTLDVYARWTDTVFTGTYRGKTVTYEIINVLPGRKLQLRIKSVADGTGRTASRKNLVAAQPDSLTPVATGDLADAIDGMEVTEIADSAFAGSDLDSIEIPDTVTSIGADAFKDCMKLTTVEIPDSVSALAAGTFDGCTNLEIVVLPDTIEEIDEQAFGTANDNLTVVANSDTASLVPENVKTEKVDVAFYSEEKESAIQAKEYQVGASDILVLSRKKQNVSSESAETQSQYEEISGNEVTWSYPQDASEFKFNTTEDGNLKVTATGETTSPVTVKATYKGQSDSIDLTAQKSTYDKSVVSIVRGLNECTDETGKVDITQSINYPTDAQDVTISVKEGNQISGVTTSTDGQMFTYLVKAGSIEKGNYLDIPVTIQSATYNDIDAVVRLQADYHVELSDGGANVSGKPVTPAVTDGNITLPNWVRTGYTFEGWKSSVDGKTYAAGTKIQIETDKDYIFTAQWKKIPVSIKISFDSQGGSSVAAKTVQEGQAYGTLATPTKTGYTFDGWYTAKSGGAKVSASTKAGTTNVTLYAHWKVNTYTVNFDKNGGSNPSVKSIQVAYGQSYGKLATVKRKGYTFSGWYTAKSGGTKISEKTTMGAGNVTVYAHWKKVSKPKTTSISSLKKGKKSFTVSYKKVKDAKGYEIRYSTNSKLKSAKTVTTKSTKATIKKLKKNKKYYVQVRAYKLDSMNKKVYGSWSKTKNVKTK